MGWAWSSWDALARDRQAACLLFFYSTVRPPIMEKRRSHVLHTSALAPHAAYNLHFIGAFGRMRHQTQAVPWSKSQINVPNKIYQILFLLLLQRLLKFSYAPHAENRALHINYRLLISAKWCLKPRRSSEAQISNKLMANVIPLIVYLTALTHFRLTSHDVSQIDHALNESIQRYYIPCTQIFGFPFIYLNHADSLNYSRVPLVFGSIWSDQRQGSVRHISTYHRQATCQMTGCWWFKIKYPYRYPHWYALHGQIRSKGILSPKK